MWLTWSVFLKLFDIGDSFLSQFLLLMTGDKLLLVSGAANGAVGAVNAVNAVWDSWEDNPNFSVNCDTVNSIFLNSLYDSYCSCSVIWLFNVRLWW